MQFKECATWLNPATRNHEITLRFETNFEELGNIYDRLPYDTLSSLEFKNMIGLALGKEPIEKIQTKYDLNRSAEKICAVPSSTNKSRNIIIAKDKL